MDTSNEQIQEQANGYTQEQVQEKVGLLEVIRQEMKASTGYKVTNVIHIVGKVLLGIAVAVTVIVMLIVNGIIGMFMAMSGAADIVSKLWELVIPCCGPVLSICIVYTVLFSTPIYAIKQLILRRRVCRREYDMEETITTYRYKLANPRERKSTKELTLENVGWSILFYQHASKGFFSKVFHFFAEFSSYIGMIVMMVALRVELVLYSLDMMNGNYSEWIFGGLIAVIIILCIVSRVQMSKRKKLLDTLRQGLKKEETSEA